MAGLLVLLNVRQSKYHFYAFGEIRLSLLPGIQHIQTAKKLL